MDITSLLQSADLSFRSISAYLNPVVIVLVILLAGIMLGGMLNSVLKSVFASTHFDDKMSSIFKSRRNYARATRHAIVRSIYFITIILVLNYIGILLYTFFLFLGLCTILLLIKLFEIVIVFYPNIKVRSALKSRIKIGEVMTVFTQYGAITGTVESIGSMNTSVRRENGDIFLLPNITFFKSRIVRRKS